MADFSSLKQTIQSYIKQNGNEEITGNILQDVLLAMVSTMGDSAINGLASALQDEITARQNQDGTLQGNITAETTARQQADTALGGRIDGLQTAINGINTKLAEGYIYAGIATPSTNPETPSGKVFYIAVSSGTYTNFSNLTVAQGINILKYNGSAWSKDVVYAIDAHPKKNSQNLVTSGGVFDNIGALDVSELNATENPHTLAQYADLSAALAAIPSDYQKGGMSIKFVQSSDNKYVQYRLMSQNWSTAPSDWKTEYFIKADSFDDSLQEQTIYGSDNTAPMQLSDFKTEKRIDAGLSSFLEFEESDIDNDGENYHAWTVHDRARTPYYIQSPFEIELNAPYYFVATHQYQKLADGTFTYIGRVPSSGHLNARTLGKPDDGFYYRIIVKNGVNGTDLFTRFDDIIKTFKGRVQKLIEIAVDGTVSSWDDIQDKPNFAAVATSGDYDDLINKPALKNVAVTGSYQDLTDKPIALNPEGSVVVDAALDPTSDNMVKNKAISMALKVNSIATLKAAMNAGYKEINFNTNGLYVELSEMLTIPEGTTIYAYNAFIRRAVGFDTTMIKMEANTHLFGLTIDGNYHAVVDKYWATACEIATALQDKQTSDYNIPGATIKDCKFVRGNCCILYFGWHNLIENCVFEDCGSAAIHFSGNYHSTVRRCYFKQCCQESSTYQHSEGAILWSNWTCYNLIEDNYFEDCEEAAIGGLDSADNCCNQIINNKMVHTGGIAGDWGSGNAPHNLIIRDNIIIDSKFGSVSYYAQLGEQAGIMLRNSSNSGNLVSPFVLNNLTIRNNFLYNSVLYVNGANNAVIDSNRLFYLKKNNVNSNVLILANSSINNNIFVNASSAGNQFKLRATTISANKIVGRGKELYLENSMGVIVRDNMIAHNNSGVNWWNSTKNSTKVDLLNNIISLVGYGQGTKLYDWSNVFGNFFTGSGDWNSPKYTVESNSRFVNVRNNSYNDNATFEGGASCTNEGNQRTGESPTEIIGTRTLNLTNVSCDLSGSANGNNYFIGLPFFFYLTANEGYSLPDTITLTCVDESGNTKTMVAGNWNTERSYNQYDANYLKWTDFKDYIYDKATGLVFIPVVYKGLTVTVVGV